MATAGTLRQPTLLDPTPKDYENLFAISPRNNAGSDSELEYDDDDTSSSSFESNDDTRATLVVYHHDDDDDEKEEEEEEEEQTTKNKRKKKQRSRDEKKVQEAHSVKGNPTRRCRGGRDIVARGAGEISDRGCKNAMNQVLKHHDAGKSERMAENTAVWSFRTLLHVGHVEREQDAFKDWSERLNARTQGLDPKGVMLVLAKETHFIREYMEMLAESSFSDATDILSERFESDKEKLKRKKKTSSKK